MNGMSYRALVMVMSSSMDLHGDTDSGNLKYERLDAVVSGPLINVGRMAGKTLGRDFPRSCAPRKSGPGGIEGVVMGSIQHMRCSRQRSMIAVYTAIPQGATRSCCTH